MVVAYRGESKLAENSLRAHLASLLRIENIGVLLGAGASVGVGGMTMATLWGEFLRNDGAAATWLLENGFVEAQHLADPEDESHQAPNVESLLDTLAITIKEWERTDNSELASAHEARVAIYRALVHASKLNENWWQSPSNTGLSETKLNSHRKMLQRLTAARMPGQPSPWIFTTNYDLAVEWSADSIDLNIINGFLGIHARKFTPQSFDLGFRNVQTRGEARFGTYNIYLAKLHGSLTWQEELDGHFYEVQASEAWTTLNSFLDKTTNELSFTVLPSAAKYVQTVGFVLGELLRRYSEFLSRPQSALLVSGYSFGDEHINRLLLSALLNPTFQLVVYFPMLQDIERTEDLPGPLARLIAMKNPRVTIVGGGSDAYFDGFAEHLPDPAIYNDDLRKFEVLLQPPDLASESGKNAT